MPLSDVSEWRVDTSTVESTLRFYNGQTRTSASFTWQYMPFTGENPAFSSRIREVYEPNSLPSVGYRVNGPDREHAVKGVLDLLYAGIFHGSNMMDVRRALEAEIKRGLIQNLPEPHEYQNLPEPHEYQVHDSNVEYTLRFYNGQTRTSASFTWQYMPFRFEHPNGDVSLRTRRMVYERNALPSVGYLVSGPDREQPAQGVLDMAYAGIFPGSNMMTVRRALEVEIKRGLIQKLLDLVGKIYVRDGSEEEPASDV